MQVWYKHLLNRTFSIKEAKVKEVAMTTQVAIQAVQDRLRAATSYEEIFGKIDGDITESKKVLKRQYNTLARMVHPDTADKEHQQLAADTFDLLTTMRGAAESAFEKGTYHTPFVAGSTKKPSTAGDVVLQSALHTYRLESDPFREGDFSSIYRAQVVSDGGRTVLVKVAADPTYNALLEKEARILKQFEGSKLAKFVPVVEDAFSVAGDGGTRFQAVIMPYLVGQMSLTSIYGAFKGEIEPPHAAWIIRRLIGQSLAARTVNVVHGAIVPDHVLVDPINHEPLHIGWAHAVSTERYERITMIMDRWRDWYPPEVLNKKQPDHTTDIYMVGKTIIWLMGGNVLRNILPKGIPDKIARLAKQCVSPDPARRPQDGKKLMDDFTRVVRAEWGKEYRPLTVPGQ